MIPITRIVRTIKTKIDIRNADKAVLKKLGITKEEYKYLKKMRKDLQKQKVIK